MIGDGGDDDVDVDADVAFDEIDYDYNAYACSYCFSQTGICNHYFL